MLKKLIICVLFSCPFSIYGMGLWNLLTSPCKKALEERKAKEQKKIDYNLAVAIITLNDTQIRYLLAQGANPDARFNCEQVAKYSISSLFYDTSNVVQIPDKIKYANALVKYCRAIKKPVMSCKEIGALYKIDFVEDKTQY